MTGGYQNSNPYSGTDEWLTPAAFQPGGWQFYDLDPAAPVVRVQETARSYYTILDNGLIKPWRGKVFLNPPYLRDVIDQWTGRMADHGSGVMLVLASTDSNWFQDHILRAAHSVLFVRQRIAFLQPNGLPARMPSGKIKRSNGPNVLVAYGMECAEVLAASDIGGELVVLRMYRRQSIDQGKTWAQLVDEWMNEHGGDVPLAELYRKAERHPKARTNKNPDAKVRQQLQRGRYRSNGDGTWRLL